MHVRVARAPRTRRKMQLLPWHDVRKFYSAGNTRVPGTHFILSGYPSTVLVGGTIRIPPVLGSLLLGWSSCWEHSSPNGGNTTLSVNGHTAFE